MAVCEACGNDYELAFEIRIRDEVHTFDSFECAIHRLAPACAHCGCRIIGHGVQAATEFYCCASCATAAGVSGARDHV